MSKQCDVCNTINHSAANHCSNCGNELPGKELSEEDILRVNLHDAKITIQSLNSIIDEKQQRIIKYEEEEHEILDINQKLIFEGQKMDYLSNSLASKELQISSLVGQINSKKRNKNVWITLLTILSIILFGCIIFLVLEVLNNQNNSSALEELSNSLKIEKSSMGQKMTELEGRNTDLNLKISQISKIYPLVITSIKIGNSYKDGTMETEFGGILHSGNTMYLVPQIKYIDLASKSIVLCQKLYQNDVLSQSVDSPPGYSSKIEISTSEIGTAVLTGWGNETKGQWASGNYRWEIWNNNNCLITLNFAIYE
jgi:hypothetical protein